MLFDLQVIDSGNSPMELHRVFDLISEARSLRRVFTADFLGQARWCDVTGWAESGPCPAYAALPEAAGEGVVLLIYGGYHGIRLKSHDCIEEWDLASPNQWGEACLLLDMDAPYEEQSVL